MQYFNLFTLKRWTRKDIKHLQQGLLNLGPQIPEVQRPGRISLLKHISHRRIREERVSDRMKQLTADSNECWKRGNRWRRLVEEKD